MTPQLRTYPPRSNLSYLILTVLSSSPQLEAKEIWAKINAKHRGASIQGVYQELSKLQKRGSIVKVKRQYALSLIWIEDVLSLAQTLQRNYLDRLDIVASLPAAGESIKWKFTDLFRMDAFYVQMTLRLLKAHRDSPMVEWCPNAWFAILQPEFEVKFKRALESAGQHVFVLLGGRSPIEKEWMKSRVSRFIHYSTRRAPLGRDSAVYFSVVGPYVVRARLPQAVMEKLRLILDSSSPGSEAAAALLRLTTSHRWAFWVSIHNQPARAERYRELFREIFMN